MGDERESAQRLATYTDAVFAVIVTVMVLELRAPDEAAFSALWPLWPTAISYVVSYLFIAVIWTMVAVVAPRLSFGLICGALVLHLRPDVPGSRA